MYVIPSPTILAGIVAGLLLPPVLALLSQGPWKVQAPGRRFILAALLISIGWVLFLAMQPTVILEDVLASLLIWLTALLVGFSIWCLIAWGFTLSLLLSIARSQQPMTFNAWVAAYTSGGNLETFARDRMAVLLRLGLARIDGESVRLTPGWGSSFAGLVSFLRCVYGIT